jgi:hypothetical protein
MAQTFTEALMEAKRRARLQGRTLSEQEAAGITQGTANAAQDRSLQEQALLLNKQTAATQEKQFGEQLAAQKEQYLGTIGLKEKELAQQQAQFGSQIGLKEQEIAAQQEQFGQTLSQREQEWLAQKEQFGQSLSATQSQFAAQLATQKEQFSQDMALKTSSFNEQLAQSQRQYEMANKTLELQKSQFEQSSAAQKEQFGEQMQFQISESQRKADELAQQMTIQQQQFTETLSLQQKQYEAQLAAAEAARNQDSGGTWICTATKEAVGTTKEERKAMKLLRRYTKATHPEWLKAYRLQGPALIRAIAKKVSDKTEFYQGVRDRLIVPVVSMVCAGDLEGAYALYRKITIDICAKFAPRELGVLTDG